MSHLHVKPVAPGALIRDPVTRRALPLDGGRVPDTTFWRRRLRAKDVILVEEQPRVTAKSPPAKSEEKAP